MLLPSLKLIYYLQQRLAFISRGFSFTLRLTLGFVLIALHYTAVSRKVVFQTGKSLRDNVEVIMGNGGRFSLRLLNQSSRCFSMVEGNSTNSCIPSFSFLVAESP